MCAKKVIQVAGSLKKLLELGVSCNYLHASISYKISEVFPQLS
jgi:hypothetical protein